MFSVFVRQRVLIGQVAKRDVVSRYKGSYLGIVWSLVTPLLMLCVYGFVFTVLFKQSGNSSWPDSSKLDFPLTLFCGLIAYNVFAEVISRAPVLVTSNPNYVKKVRFPLEILAIAALYTALVNGGFGLAILLVGWIALHHSISSTIWLSPLMLLPLCIFTLGLAWLLSSLGVFIRDVMHPVGVLVQVMLFMSAVFYPLSILRNPLELKLIKLNPLVTMIDNLRRTLIWGMQPNWTWWGIAMAGSLVVMLLGYYWFMSSCKAFADVI